MVTKRREIALSFDVEEWFQTEALSSTFPESTHGDLPRRAEETVLSLLDLLKERSGRATFFLLGMVLDGCRDLPWRILEAGHEIASHGFGHVPLTRSGPDDFRRDLERFSNLCSSLGLPPPSGYRAPSFTMVAQTAPWAVDALVEAGYSWDSSVYPMFRHRYGMPEAPLAPFTLLGSSQGIHELPVASLGLGRHRVPAGGGAWMRLYPGRLHRAMLGRISARGVTPVVYSHPWEYSGAIPVRCSPPLLQRARQSFHSGRLMYSRLDSLLADFDTVTLGELEERSVLSGRFEKEMRPG